MSSSVEGILLQYTFDIDLQQFYLDGLLCLQNLSDLLKTFSRGF